MGWQAEEDGKSEGRLVMRRIGVASHSARKRADFHRVFLHERVWLTDAEGKADDGRDEHDCWCSLPREGGLARHRLAQGPPHRESAPSAYREGDAKFGRCDTASRTGRLKGLSCM